MSRRMRERRELCPASLLLFIAFRSYGEVLRWESCNYWEYSLFRSFLLNLPTRLFFSH